MNGYGTFHCLRKFKLSHENLIPSIRTADGLDLFQTQGLFSGESYINYLSNSGINEVCGESLCVGSS